MIKKSKFNKLLATVSTFALISGASSAAMGDVVQTGGNETLGANGTWGGGNAPADNDVIRLGGHGHTLDADVANRIIAAYDNAGFNPGDITINQNLVLGSVSGAGGAVDVVFGDARTFTLTGTAGGAIVANTYNKLGGLDFANKAANLVIKNAAGVETFLEGDIANARNAIIDVTTSLKANATFADAKTINIANAQTLHIDAGNNNVTPNNVGRGNITFGGVDSALKFTVDANGGKAITFGNACDPVGGGADVKGRLEVVNTAAAGQLLTLDTGGAEIGNANDHRLKEFITAGTGEIKITNGGIFAKKISINGTGQVEFDDDLDSGANSTLTFGGDGDVLFSGDAEVTTIDFNGKNAKVNVANGKTITGNVTTAAPNTGNLVFEQAGGVVGTIGAKDLALKTVEVTGAGAVALDGKAHYAKTFLFKDNAAQLTIADGGSLTGNAVANAAGNGVIEFTKSGTFTGTLGDAKNHLGAVIANGAGAVTIGAGNHRVGTFKAANAGSIFDFADGATLSTHAIDNTSGAVGATKLNFVGSGGVSGVVGGTNPFAEINLKGGKEAVVTFTNDTNATNFNIGAGTGVLDSTKADRTLAAEVKFTDIFNGKLLIKGANNATIDGAVAQVGNRGTVTIASDVANKNVTFNDVVGVAADANALKRLEIENGFTGQVQLDADTHITDVEINGGSIRLGANNYKFGGISGNGTLLVNADGATLMGPDAPADAEINLGTADNRLAKLEFAADHTLSIGDGVNIHVDTLQFNANDQGKLAFEGTSIFEANATGGGNGKLNTITLDDKAKVTILSPDTVVNGLTALGNNSTLTIAGKFNANGGLQGANDAAGTLRFVNNATITGNVGAAGKSLACIEFAGSDVAFTGDVVHKAGQAFVFSSDTASTVKFNDKTNIGDNVFTNNSDANITHTIVLTKAGVTEFTQNLATSVDKQLNFQLAAGVNAKITGGDATGTNFVSADNKAELELAKAGTVINSAGDFSKSFGKVVFSESATITNNTYAGELKVNAGRTATLGGAIQSGKFHLAAAGSTVSFLDNATVNSVIKTDVDSEGVVEFTGGADINENLGEQAKVLNSVTFANDAKKTAELGADIYATNIAMRQGVVKLTSDAELNGVTTANATTLDLGDKKLTANDNLTFHGANKIKFSTTNSGNTLTGGQITIADGKNLEFIANTSLAITADDEGNARPVGGASHDFTLIDGNVVAAKLDIDKVTVENKNDFTSWTHTVSKDGLILTQTDNAARKLKELLGDKDAANIANAEALAKAEQGTQGYKLVELLSTISKDSDKTTEVFNNLTPLTTIVDSIQNTTANVGESLGTRTISLAGNQANPVETRTVGSESVVGVSAGDDHHARFGAWFSPFYNNTTQKARKGAAGYKGESYGASFGFDTRTNEDMIIGAAFTAANSELKHKNFKSGSKTKVNSLLFSIYGMQQLTDTWFALGSATVGTNEVKNNERRGYVNNHEAARAKYSSMSFSGEVMFGYNHIIEQATITPMGGFRYTRVNDGGYKETGTAIQNLDVSTKASNKFEVILGARASGGTFDFNGMSVTPEVHAFVNHDLINKNPKQDIKLDSSALTGKSSKPVRTSYNLGLGANAEFGMMEYGASYDAQLANKRVGHQGTLRVRVNF
jgi:outer membrane autotransporter protein